MQKERHMKNWKFVMACLAALVPLAMICIFTRTHALSFMDNEAPYYIWNKEIVESPQTGRYDVIILGDSTANASYVPAVLSDKTLNLALGGTTPVDNYYIMLDWLKHHPAPKTCYISFADFHFRTEDWFWERILYTHRFCLSYNLEIMKKAYEHKEASILTEDYVPNFIYYELWFPNIYLSLMKNVNFAQRNKDNRFAQQAAERHAGRYMARGIREYEAVEDTFPERFYTTALFDEYYRKLLGLCRDNGIQVRILKLPQHGSVHYTKAYRDSFWEYYDELKKEYPGISVDWFENSGADCFADVNHMNSRGALQFSTELKKRYPEDFQSGDMTINQIAAINDEITSENKIEWILNWTAGRDYTVVVEDSSGMFPQIYEDKIKDSVWDRGMELCQLETGADASPKLYYISGNDDDPAELSSVMREDYIKEMLETVQMEREGESEDGLVIDVIDHYNDAMVCQKNYKYMDQAYVYEQ